MPKRPVHPLAILVAIASTLALPAAARALTDGSVRMAKSQQRQLTSVPAATLNSVGTKGVLPSGNLFKIATPSGPPLTTDGKPQILSFDFEWCPHCMVTSWSLVVALSRFGKWSTLRSVDSGTYFGQRFPALPSYDHTNGVSFLGVGYHSRFLAFAGVEGQSNTGAPLERLDSAQGAAFNEADGSNIVPFIDFGGKVATISSGFSPAALSGLTDAQIVRAAHRGKGAAGRDIDALANLFTAGICKATGGKPAAVCRSEAAKAGARRLAAG